MSEKQNKTANIALMLSVSSIIVPVLIYSLAMAFTDVKPGRIQQPLGFLFLAFLMGSIMTGVAGWQQRNGKIAVAFAITVLVLVVLFSLISVSAPKDSHLDNGPARTESPKENSSSQASEVKEPSSDE